MDQQGLSALFDPRSLVVVAEQPLFLPPTPTTLEHATTRAAFDDDGMPTLPALRGLTPGQRPDLALVSVPSSRLAPALRAMTNARPRAAIIYCQATPEDETFCHDWARAHDCVLIGPHSFGLQRPVAGLNASLHPTLARVGRVALVAQSRAIMSAVMDWADDTRTAFSAAIGTGDHPSVNIAALLDFFAFDRHTDSMVVYLEDIGDAREFMSALRAAASVKPVVVLRAAPPDGDDSGIPPETVFDAALRRAGALRARYFVQLFSTMKALSHLNRPRGRRLALFANGNGPIHLAQNVVAQQRPITFASPSGETRTVLAATLSASAHVGNPVVEPSPLAATTFAKAINCLVADAGVDGVLVLLTPDPQSDMDGAVEQLIQIVPRARKPIIVCLMGDSTMRRRRRRLAEAGIPAFRTPETATDAFGQLARFHYNQQLLVQTQPPDAMASPPDLDAVRRWIADALAQGQRCLDADESHQLLKAFHIPGPASQDNTPSGVASRPTGSRATPFAQEPLTAAASVRIRVVHDPTFGAAISLDASGAWPTASSAGVELLPLNGFLARRLIERSDAGVHRLMQEATPLALEKLEDVLVAISELAVALPEVTEGVFDPVLISDSDVAVQHARFAIADTADPENRYRHLAIAPYPGHWVRSKALRDGTSWVLRPIRPEDAEALQNFIRGLSEQTRYMRFISAMRELPARMLARYTQIDYHRELAFIATVEQPNPLHRNHPHEIIVGLAHYLRGADGVGAEYALVVADEWQRKGLGPILMQALIDAAREHRLSYLEGSVLGTNRPMLKLMTELGFRNDQDPDDPSMRRVWLPLSRT